MLNIFPSAKAVPARRVTQLYRAELSLHISNFPNYSKHWLKIPPSTGTKRRVGSPRRRWEDNITMNLKEIGANTNNWVHSTQVSD